MILPWNHLCAKPENITYIYYIYWIMCFTYSCISYKRNNSLFGITSIFSWWLVLLSSRKMQIVVTSNYPVYFFVIICFMWYFLSYCIKTYENTAPFYVLLLPEWDFVFSKSGDLIEVLTTAVDCRLCKSLQKIIMHVHNKNEKIVSSYFIHILRQ